jgi:hypothetical protein
LNDLYKEKNGEYQRKEIKNFGYCQGYMALQYHLEEAIREENKDKLFNHPFLATPDPRIAIFSHKYYNELQAIPKDKEYDFCWIGSMESCTEHRGWIIDFAKKHFTKDSIFINTDCPDNWEKLGNFDLTALKLGYSPKSFDNSQNQSKEVQYRKVAENLFYFQSMRQSKFTLCPRGEAPWSFRFYEILMCETIPIVYSEHDTYRTLEESKFDYQYLLQSQEKFIYDDSIVKHNTNIFTTNHLFRKLNLSYVI